MDLQSLEKVTDEEHDTICRKAYPYEDWNSL